MNAKIPSAVPLAAAVAIGALLAACSRTEAPPQTAPLVGTEMQDERASVVLAGIPSTYSTDYEADQLVRIVESRALPDGSRRRGNYQFYGARLTRYSGSSLRDGTPVELSFDLQGRLISAKLGERDEVPDEEIALLKSRAQLLRSHALAHRPDALHRGH